MCKFDGFLLALVALWHFSFGASVAAAFDYFTAAQDGQAHYLDLATKNHADKAYGFIRDGRLNNAIEELRYALDRFPNHPNALQTMGVVAKMAKKPDLAIEYFQNALNLYPQYAVTHAQYGQFLLSIGDVDKAVESLKKAIEIDPKLAAGYALLARAYAKQGNSKLAGEAATRARELGYKGSLPGVDGSQQAK